MTEADKLRKAATHKAQDAVRERREAEGLRGQAAQARHEGDRLDAAAERKDASADRHAQQATDLRNQADSEETAA